MNGLERARRRGWRASREGARRDAKQLSFPYEHMASKRNMAPRHVEISREATEQLSRVMDEAFDGNGEVVYMDSDSVVVRGRGER